jgi:hypothetical protein
MAGPPAPVCCARWSPRGRTVGVRGRPGRLGAAIFRSAQAQGGTALPLTGPVARFDGKRGRSW